MSDMNFEFLLKFWFLPVLFVASVVYMIVDIIAAKSANRLSLLLSAFAIIILQIYGLENNNILLVQLCIVPYALLFYTLGNIVYPHIDFLYNYLNTRKPAYGMLTFTSLPLVFVLSQINTPIKMYANQYGNFAMFFICACAAILPVIILSKKLSNTLFLEYAGRYSVAIYVWQFITCDIASSLSGRLLQTYGADCQIAFAFIVSTLLSLVIVSTTVRYFPQMYSIKK